MLNILPSIPNVFNLESRTFLQIASKAFEKSTKQQYNSDLYEIVYQ